MPHISARPYLSARLLALALTAGFAAAPASAWAESKAKPATMKKAETSQSGGSSGGASDFEENRKAHAQKSKENNEKKGAN